MKKIILSIAFASLLLSGFAQDSLRTKPRNNEFGIDATGFIKQFISINISEYPESYSPIYYLTYRRHFKTGNIRSAIGGSFYDENVNSISSLDSHKYRSNYYGFGARIGWEFFNNLGKRWQVYYGLDFKVNYMHYKNDAYTFDGEYARGRETRIQNYGLAPVLGLKFKILKRLSISTEACFTVYMQQEEKRMYYTPMYSSVMARPDDFTPIIKMLSSSFTQPISVFIAFDF